MPFRKTPLRETSGVKLVQVEEVSPDGARVHSVHYHVSTVRQAPPRVIVDEEEALVAFDLEVIASLADPTVAHALGH